MNGKKEKKEKSLERNFKSSFKLIISSSGEPQKQQTDNNITRY